MSEIKARLLEALHHAVRSFNDGDSPTDAVVKAAEAFDFNVDQTCRLAEMFNTARTIYHYKTAKDRTTPFELVDPAVAVTKLYKSGKTDKAAVSDIGYSYTEYDREDRDYVRFDDDYDTIELIDKAALENDDIKDTTIDFHSDKARRVIDEYRKTAEVATDTANMLSTKAGLLLDTLAEQLKVGYEEEVIDRYSRLATICNQRDGLKEAFDLLAVRMPNWTNDNIKSINRVINDLDLANELETLKEAQWLLTEADKLIKEGQRYKVDAEDFEREWNKLILGDRQVKAASASDLVSVEAKPRAPKKDKPKTKSMFELSIEKGIDKGVDKVVSDAISTIVRPKRDEAKELESKLKNVQRQMLLEDLLITDPVLSEEDPEVVTNAYKAIVAISPNVALNKEIVRSVLRQAVQSIAISPYDAEVWANLEKNLMQISGKMPISGSKQINPPKGS